MTIIGIQPDDSGEDSYSKKWIECLEKRGVQTQILNLYSPDALEQARSCDGVMWRVIHSAQDKQIARRVLFVIEHYLKIPVFPNHQTAWHFDEKTAQYYLFQILGVPTPKTWLFWNKESALDWSHIAPYPLVFKLSVGASSSNVLKVENQEQAVQLINKSFEHGIFPSTMNEYAYESRFPRTKEEYLDLRRRFSLVRDYVWRREYPPLPNGWFCLPEKGYVYFQEFLPGNQFATRIFVIGNRAFCYRTMNRPGDFRASGSHLRRYDREGLDMRCVEMGFRISENGMFQSMGYDFLQKDGQVVLSEASYIGDELSLYQSPGHYRRDMTWVEGHLFPEEAQVEDFLEEVEGKR